MTIYVNRCIVFAMTPKDIHTGQVERERVKIVRPQDLIVLETMVPLGRVLQASGVPGLLVDHFIYNRPLGTKHWRAIDGQLPPEDQSEHLPFTTLKNEIGAKETGGRYPLDWEGVADRAYVISEATLIAVTGRQPNGRKVRDLAGLIIHSEERQQVTGENPQGGEVEQAIQRFVLTEAGRELDLVGESMDRLDIYDHVLRGLYAGGLTPWEIIPNAQDSALLSIMAVERHLLRLVENGTDYEKALAQRMLDGNNNLFGYPWGVPGDAWGQADTRDISTAAGMRANVFLGTVLGVMDIPDEKRDALRFRLLSRMQASEQAQQRELVAIMNGDKISQVQARNEIDQADNEYLETFDARGLGLPTRRILFQDED